MGFAAMCLLLTVPECTKCCRTADHRTLHSINARAALYTLAIGALVNSCAKMLDCTLQPDGTYTLDAQPELTCWEDDQPHVLLAPLGAIGLVIYCVVVPFKLFCTLRRSAKDGHWSMEEMEKHAWLILKYKPSRWWFEFALLYNKIFFILLTIFLDSEAWAWHLLGSLALLTTATLVLVAVDKPFRGDSSGRMGQEQNQVLPGPATHTVTAKAIVRCDSSTTSKVVDAMYPGQHACIIEATMQDGHQRARIGAGRWISQRTAAGSTLLVPFAPDTPMYSLVEPAVVRNGSSVGSDEVGKIQPGTVVIVLEEAENDGHRRARVGADRWISLRTSKGKVLATPFGSTASEVDVVPETEGEHKHRDHAKDLETTFRR